MAIDSYSISRKTPLQAPVAINTPAHNAFRKPSPLHWTWTTCVYINIYMCIDMVILTSTLGSVPFSTFVIAVTVVRAFVILDIIYTFVVVVDHNNFFLSTFTCFLCKIGTLNQRRQHKGNVQKQYIINIGTV